VATVLFERKTKMTDRDPGDDCQGNIVERRRISASRSGLYRPALVAVGIGLMLSLIAAYAVGRWEQRVTKVEFEGVAATATPPASASEHSPPRSDWVARWMATSEEEQAVSTVIAGPSRPNV